LLKRGQAIREHHVVGYVSDARKAKVFVTEDLQWVSEVWLPQVVKAGLKRMAMEWMIANDTLCNSQGYATKKTPPQLGILCGFP